MPEMDGVEALKQIKALNENIEVLIMTGYANIDSLKELLFDYGARDYLLKPFNTVELNIAVQRALRNRELALKNSLVKEELENRILELERDFKEKTFRMNRPGTCIRLIALGALPGEIFHPLSRGLEAVYGLPVRSGDPLDLPPWAYLPRRRQYDSSQLLRFLGGKIPPP